MRYKPKPRTIEQMKADKRESIQSALESLGFEKQGTGGGCECMYKPIGKGLALILTDGDFGVPETSDTPITLAMAHPLDIEAYDMNGEFSQTIIDGGMTVGEYLESEV